MSSRTTSTADRRQDNQPLLWTGPRRVRMLSYSSARPARRVAGHRASSVELNRRAVGRRPVFGTLSIAAAFSLTSDYQFATPPFLSEICYEYNPL